MAKGIRHKKWFAEAIYDLKIGKTTFEWPDRSLFNADEFRLE